MKSKSESVTKSKTAKVKKQEDELETPELVTVSTDCSLEQLIAEEAYFIAERRGFAPENDLDDWLQAEATVKERLRSAQ